MDISFLFAVILWAQEEGAKQASQPNPFANPLFLFMVIILLFFVLVVWPNQRRAKKDQEEKINNLKKNDKVILQSGIIGVISSIKEDSNEVVLKLEEGKIRVLKSSIHGPLEAASQEDKKDTKEAVKEANKEQSKEAESKEAETAIKKA